MTTQNKSLIGHKSNCYQDSHIKGHNFINSPYLDEALTDPEIKTNAEEPGTGITEFTKKTHQKTGITNTVNDSEGILLMLVKNEFCFLEKLFALI